ncbi:T/G mismatch-specific endonuclease [Alkalibacterium subtropicum]|uniref:Very short patch repair endonuclease n=1 Tax=Alkalibacterium subtropicum TaxID=753702 RepID=A0A1I1FMW8_9LACT|nr:very short patch repair endonuclease [Alkalibacterium subtropicum]SFC00336.1 T/G mismatch-specific endonuclease [Alkalibacterium subtropicum]
MTDTVSKSMRSRNMSKIRSKNTKPEIQVRKYLFSRGLRYRLHAKNLPGKPDMVFPKYKTVVFVNGCFWHHHSCKYGTTPKTNTEYWLNKFEKNQMRDNSNYQTLESEGWKVLVIWECQINSKNRITFLENLYSEIKFS